MINKLIHIATGVLIAATIVFTIGTIAWAAYMQYQAEVTAVNTGSTYTGRVQMTVPVKSLIDGGFIQADADDVELYGYDITAMYLGTSGTATWTAAELVVNAGINEYLLYVGSPPMTRDQRWCSDDGDTITVTDHADLDVETMFMLEVDIEPTANPGTEVAIIQKAGAYELILNGTPNYVFRLWQGGAPTSVSIAATLDTEVTLQAWYNGGTMTLSDGSNQDSATLSGSITQNSANISICELDGFCNDAHLRIN